MYYVVMYYITSLHHKDIHMSADNPIDRARKRIVSELTALGLPTNLFNDIVFTRVEPDSVHVRRLEDGAAGLTYKLRQQKARKDRKARLS